MGDEGRSNIISQCSTLVCTLLQGRYLQSIVDSDFRPPGSETPEPIKLKFGKIDYVQHTTPHTKTDTRRFRGIG